MVRPTAVCHDVRRGRRRGKKPAARRKSRATLDGLPLAPAEFEALADEVRLAFRLDADVFADLMAAPAA